MTIRTGLSWHLLMRTIRFSQAVFFGRAMDGTVRRMAGLEREGGTRTGSTLWRAALVENALCDGSSRMRALIAAIEFGLYPPRR